MRLFSIKNGIIVSTVAILSYLAFIGRTVIVRQKFRTRPLSSEIM